MKFPTSKVISGLTSLLGVLALASSMAKADSLVYAGGASTPAGANPYVSESTQPYGFAPGTVFTVGADDLSVTELGAWAGDANSQLGSTQQGLNPTYVTVGGITTTTQPFTAVIYDVTTHTTVAQSVISAGTVVDSQGFAYSSVLTTSGNVPLVGLTLTSGDKYDVYDFGGLPGQPGGYYVVGQGPLLVADPTYVPPTTPFSRTYNSNPDNLIPIESGTGLTIVGASGDYGYGSTTFTPNPITGPVDHSPPTTYDGSDFSLANSVGGNFIYETIPEPSDLAYMAIGGAVLFFTLRRKMADNSSI